MTTRISHQDYVSGRYLVVTDTPDGGRSTFPECWGQGHQFDARAVSASDSLIDVFAECRRWGSDARVYDRVTGRLVGTKRLTQETY